MTLETLAQDIFDKEQAVLEQRIMLSRAKLALSDAKAALTDALCDSGEPIYKQVAINLLDHVVVCEWNGDSEYDATFIWKAPHANS